MVIRKYFFPESENDSNKIAKFYMDFGPRTDWKSCGKFYIWQRFQFKTNEILSTTL